MDSTPVPAERADARRNRTLLLEAAARCVAQRGVTVSAFDIAAAAGVSVATLYRRFTTKEALIETVLLELLTELNDAATSALGDPDSWSGLAQFIRTFARMNKDNHGLSELVGMPETASMASALSTLRATIRELVTRAKRAGLIRQDVEWADVAFMSKASLVGTSCIGLAAGPHEWERCLTLMLDGLRTSEPSALPGKGPRLLPRPGADPPGR